MIDSDEIKQRIDIVEYISRYTPLKKAGSTYKGLCPFHTEKTPSFVVYADEGRWHCFGACSEGGDIFNFVQKKENLDFMGAAEVLAREAGIDISRSGGSQEHAKRTSLFELNEEAADYFSAMLRDSPQGEAARDYVQRRGLDAETVELFGIGFAPDSWDSLRDHLSAKGYDIETQFVAGVLKHNEERNSYYDAFRNRLIVPIRDTIGRIIGFGGRVLDDSVPKYLNTGDTPLFKKSHVVFGIDRAREAIRDAGEVVIVEGYMDVIAAHQFGFGNVVACMGTALTAEQLRLLQRHTRKFVFALDADSAGQQATIRGINQARQGLARVKKPVAGPGRRMRLEDRLAAELFILAMPAGTDPDDVIREDSDEWRRLVDSAQPLVDYFFDVVSKQYDLSSAKGKGDAVNALTPLIAELEDDIAQRHYIQKLSHLVAVDELTIEGRVRSSATTSAIPVTEKSRTGRNRRLAQARPSAGVGNHPPASAAPGSGYVAPPNGASLDQESYLLANFLRLPETIIWITTRVQELSISPPEPQDWQKPENRAIFESLKLYLAGDDPWEPELFRLGVPDALHAHLDRLLAEADRLPKCDWEELRIDLLKVLVRVRIEHLRLDNQRIRFMVTQAQSAGDTAAVRSFDSTNNQNLRELNHLQSTLADLTRVMAVNGRSPQSVKYR